MIEKYKKLPIQAKAAAWYTICNFFQNGISFLVVPLYIRILSKAEYGRWSVFQSWRDILIIFASLNLYAGVYTKTLVDNKFDRDKYTSSMQGLGTTCSFCVFFIYLLLHKWVDKSVEVSFQYIILLFIYFTLYPSFLLWMARQRVEYKYINVVIVTALISMGVPALSIFLVFAYGKSAESLILGFLLIQCLTGLHFYYIQFKKGKVFFNLEYWKYALTYNLPLIPHYLSLIILNQSDRIMIKHYCGDGDAGIYSFSYQLAFAISIVITAINGSRVPWTYEKIKTGQFNSLNKITCSLVILLSGITFLFALLSPEILNVIGTEEYKSAVYVIPVVSLGLFYTFVYDLFAAVEFYYGYTKYVMYASTIGASLNILLNIFFIPKFGYIAAAYTTLACYAVFMLMHYFFYKHILYKQKITKEIYNDKAIFAISGITTFLLFLVVISFNYVLLRLSMIIVMMIMFLIFKNKILLIIQEILKKTE